MENTGEVLTPAVAVPIQGTVEVAGEAFGSAVEPVMESAEMPPFGEIPIEGLPEEEHNPFSFEEVLSEEDDSTEVSEGELIEQARQELEEINNKNEDFEEEKDNGYDEQLAMLNETIRLLEIQRDDIKEQLGGGLTTFFAKLADYFFAETLMDKPSLVENSPMNQPSGAWKEDARHQLRALESKIAELKQFRERFVANN